MLVSAPPKSTQFNLFSFTTGGPKLLLCFRNILNHIIEFLSTESYFNLFHENYSRLIMQLCEVPSYCSLIGRKQFTSKSSISEMQKKKKRRHFATSISILRPTINQVCCKYIPKSFCKRSNLQLSIHNRRPKC